MPCSGYQTLQAACLLLGMCTANFSCNFHKYFLNTQMVFSTLFGNESLCLFKRRSFDGDFPKSLDMFLLLTMEDN